MAEEQDPSQPRISSAFPAPPPFWKQFTSETLEKVEDLKKEKNPELLPSKWTPAELRTLELPSELRLLVPPEPPASGTYTCFGQELSIGGDLPTLSSKGVSQLFPSTTNSAEPLNHAFALHKLAKSILLNFLEYVGILSNSPDHHESKLQDIQTLFSNAHQLINMYRPHQARETLILRMEKEIEEGRKEIREMRTVMGKMEGALKELEEDGREVGASARGEGKKSIIGDNEKRAATRSWEILDLDSDED